MSKVDFEICQKTSERHFKKLMSNLAIPIDPRRNIEKEKLHWNKDFEKALKATASNELGRAIRSLRTYYGSSDVMCPGLLKVYQGDAQGWIDAYRWYDATWWNTYADPNKLNSLSSTTSSYPLLLPIATLLGHSHRANEIGEFLYAGAKTTHSDGTMLVFPNGDYLASTRLVAQLWAAQHERTLDAFGEYRELSDFHRYLVDLASEPGDPAKAQEALYAACAFHVADFLDESGYSCFDNYFLAVCPIEILYLNWIRRKKGFPELTSDHPLMMSPFSQFPVVPFEPAIRELNMIRALDKLIAHNRMTKEDLVFLMKFNQINF